MSRTKQRKLAKQHQGRPQAAALEYRTLDHLPKVLVSGYGETARQIIATATAHQVPISSDPKLARMLVKVESGDWISPEAFALVAELLAHLYHQDETWRKEHGFIGQLISKGTAI